MLLLGDVDDDDDGGDTFDGYWMMVLRERNKSPRKSRQSSGTMILVK